MDVKSGQTIKSVQMKTKSLLLPLLIWAFLAANTSTATAHASAAYDSTSVKVPYRHGFSIGVIPAYSILKYKSDASSSKGGLGYGASLTYSYLFTKHWGFDVGASFNTFKGKYSFDGITTVSPTYTETHGNTYNVTQVLTTEEEQNLGYLLLPLRLTFRCHLSSNLYFKTALGAAYAFNVYEDRVVKSGTIVRSAYFPVIDVTVKELPEQTLGTYNTYINRSSKNQFKDAIVGVGELGFDYAITPKLYLNTTLHAVYGGDIKNQSGELLQQLSYSGVTTTNYIGSVKPISVGVNFGLIFRFGKSKTAASAPLAAASNFVTTPTYREAAEMTQPQQKKAAEPIVANPKVEQPAAVENQSEDPLIKIREYADKLNADSDNHFEFNSTALNSYSKKSFLEFVELIKNADVEIVLVGHTCNVGDESINRRIGLLRAQIVKNYMMVHGVKGDNIKIATKGSKNPKYSNATKEGRLKNRRVEIVIK